MKLPDPLLVRYYRDGKIDAISGVEETPVTRDLAITMTDGRQERWKYLVDVGWVPDAD